MWLENALAFGFAAGFFAFIAVSVLLSRLRLVEYTPREVPLSASRFFSIAILFLPLALFEEFLFRWLMIGQLEGWIGLVPAFLLSVAAFVAAHRPNGRLSFLALLNLSVVSVILGFTFLNWGIWVASAAHAGWNVAEWGMGYAVSGEKMRTVLPSPARREVQGEPFGPEGHWTATVVLLVVLLSLIATHPLH
ncbi:MAG: CPBP family intramembrane metalloprotease [Thermaerobacter sp.]|nr:CPBP family intramembrane metalloprotease [Thermaerobacter sp.]